MADVTGHMDRPGAGPWSVNQAVDGILTGYYTHPNSETGKVELVKGNPSGIPGYGCEGVLRYVRRATVA